MEYTKRHNVNRGYMKLEVWNNAIELFELIHKMLSACQRLDYKLRAQILDSSQSISSNISEGYCRRSLNEYLQFLNVALGSSGETMTRMIGLCRTGYVALEQFEEFDKLHYQVENKLVALIKSLQLKRKTGEWEIEFREADEPYLP